MAKIYETLLHMTLLYLFVIGSPLAAEQTIQNNEQSLLSRSKSSQFQSRKPFTAPLFGSFYSGPYRGLSRYEIPPLQPSNHLSLSFGSFYSGPYHGSPNYEIPPPPPPTNHLSSSFGSFYSGPYRGPPRYEIPPPPLSNHLSSPFESFYSGSYHGPPLYEIPPPPRA
ncbi:hypothetical protein RIF29_05066 [Crotalaria pallida]|uniref:Uncharacterized protein n=1 Tax=Crotalaria pallida TaxID=3830 RepID=A0AAN9J468_CROPI